MVEAIIETGRTHQIRRHFSMMGSPILGDVRYSADKDIAKKEKIMYLCATGLQFDHPVLKGIRLKESIPVPLFIQRLQGRLD